MSQWCDECKRSKLSGKWHSCDDTCPVFGCHLDELAEKHLKLVTKVQQLKKSATLVDAIAKHNDTGMMRDMVELMLKEMNTIIDTLINLDT